MICRLLMIYTMATTALVNREQAKSTQKHSTDCARQRIVRDLERERLKDTKYANGINEYFADNIHEHFDLLSTLQLYL